MSEQTDTSTEQDRPTNATEGGAHDAGRNGEDCDILGKKQEDLTADDLKGDARAGD